MPRPKGRDEKLKGRDEEIYEYYSNLISKAVGYTKAKARELTLEKFSTWNITDGRLQHIICEQAKVAEAVKKVARETVGK